MTTYNSLSRRRLLLSVLVGVAALRILSPKRVFSKALSLGARKAGRDSLLQALLADLTPFHAIGRAYLARTPDEANVEHLHQALFGDDIPTNKDALLARIALQEQDDFVSGRLVPMDGWLLSRTSVRVSALAVLTGDGTAV
jgi:hypothetical protein